MARASPALATAPAEACRGAHIIPATRQPLAGRCGGKLPTAATAVVLAGAEVPAPAATVSRARQPLEVQA